MKKYTDDYDIISSLDEKGREKRTAVYHGPYFEFMTDEEGLTQFRRKCYVLLAAIVLFHVCGGFVDNEGMYQFYVALPYVIAFLPLIFLCFGALHLPREKRKCRRDEIGLSYDRMKIASRWLIAFLAIGVLGEVVFLLFVSAGRQNWQEYLYLALEVFSAIAVYYLIQVQKRIRVQNCDA